MSKATFPERGRRENGTFYDLPKLPCGPWKQSQNKNWFREVKNDDGTKFGTDFVKTDGNGEPYIERVRAGEILDERPGITERAYSLMLQRKTGEATELVADYIKTKIPSFKSTRVDKNSELYYYEDGIFRPGGRAKIQEETRKILGDAYTTQFANWVITKIEADSYIDEKEFFRSAEKNPHEVPVQNGILNLETGELKPFTPDKIFFTKLPVPYDPEAKCPEFLRFLGSIVENDEAVLTIQEIFGYAPFREYRYEKIFVFVGQGRNGKGKLLSVLIALLGSEAVAGESLQTLEEDQFAEANLFGKLVNITGDLPERPLKSTANIKGLTGRDLRSANRKNLNRLNFVNCAKFISAANGLPRGSGIAQAFFDRLIILHFPKRFLPQNELDLMSDEEKKNCFPQDENILERMTTPSELSGVLNWALEGFRRLQKNHGFTYSKTSSTVRDEWVALSNSLAAFCKLNVEIDASSSIPKKEFFRAYLEFCSSRKLKPVSTKFFKNYLESEYGAEEERPYAGPGLNSERVWTGIRLKSGLFQDFRGVSPYSEKFGFPVKTNTPEFPEETGILLDRFRALFSGSYAGRPLAIEVVQRRLPEVSDDVLRSWLDRGEAVELPVGWVMPT